MIEPGRVFLGYLSETPEQPQPGDGGRERGNLKEQFAGLPLQLAENLGRPGDAQNRGNGDFGRPYSLTLDPADECRKEVFIVQFRGNSESCVGSRVENRNLSVREPPRQITRKEVLDVFEGYDVKQTAQIMKCSDGSVKTHYSRAVHVLREKLGDDW